MLLDQDYRPIMWQAAPSPVKTKQSPKTLYGKHSTNSTGGGLHQGATSGSKTNQLSHLEKPDVKKDSSPSPPTQS